MIKSAVGQVDFVRYTKDTRDECSKLCGRNWYSGGGDDKYGNKIADRIWSHGSIQVVQQGDYITRDALHTLEVYCASDFNIKFRQGAATTSPIFKDLPKTRIEEGSNPRWPQWMIDAKEKE